MTFQRATIASLATLGLGALATGAALVQAAGFSALLSGFGLLALSPYAVFCGACFLPTATVAEPSPTLLVCAVAAAASALFFYGDLIFLNPGSMSGFIFLFVPCYQLPAAILLVAVLFFTRPQSRKSSNA